MTHHHKLSKLMVYAAIALPHFLSAQSPSDKVETLQKKVVVTNERTVNTRQLEFSPAFFEDGIVFISSQKPLAKEKIFDNRIESGTMSIFLARRDEYGQLGKPTAFANSLVSSLHEGPLTFDKTAENVYFSRNNSEKDGKKAKYTEGVSRLKIFTAQRQSEADWGPPTEVSFSENNSDACHPSVSIDGDKLYFSSNRKGGYGGMDLYVSEKTDNGMWGKPRNLGSKINTAKNEVFPFIHADGTLFYSSDGLKGTGGLDIFYALWEVADFSNSTANNQQKSGFNTPTNLGELFNSNKDDFGFIIDLDMKNGYLTSNKTGGVGSDDIYAFNIQNGTLFDEDVAGKRDVVAAATPHVVSTPVTRNNAKANPKTSLKTNPKTKANPVVAAAPKPSNNELAAHQERVNLLVVDRQTGKPIADATTLYLNLNDLSILDVVSNGKQAQFIKSDGSFALELMGSKTIKNQTNSVGKAQIELDKDGNYVIDVNKQGYAAEQITLKKDDERADILVLLDRETGVKKPSMVVQNFTIREGLSLKLNNVYYNYNDASIRPDAAKDLNALYSVMIKYPDMEVELSAHTDARGTADYNDELSQRRAESAVQYLVNRGIAAQRITAKGYGERRLRNHCGDGVFCSEDAHKINRRTEVKIIKSGSAEGKNIGVLGY